MSQGGPAPQFTFIPPNMQPDGRVQLRQPVPPPPYQGQHVPPAPGPYYNQRPPMYRGPFPAHQPLMVTPQMQAQTTWIPETERAKFFMKKKKVKTQQTSNLEDYADAKIKDKAPG